jgi:hypothetical protein
MKEYKKEPKKDFRGVIERDAQGNPCNEHRRMMRLKARLVDAKDIVSA